MNELNIKELRAAKKKIDSAIEKVVPIFNGYPKYDLNDEELKNCLSKLVEANESIEILIKNNQE